MSMPELPLLFNTSVAMSHRFVIMIDRVAYNFGTWQKVSGLKVTWKTCEYRSGDEGNHVTILPGTTGYDAIELSRAACAESRIVQYWLSQTAKHPQPLSGTIQLIDWLGVATVQWQLKEFFPIGWSISNFSTSQPEPVIETLKLAHTGFLEDEISMLSPF